jgi:hypothetical protein
MGRFLQQKAAKGGAAALPGGEVAGGHVGRAFQAHLGEH